MDTIRLFCENTQTHVTVTMGSNLKDLALKECAGKGTLPVIAVLVDNKLKSLDYKVMNPHNIRFIGYDHPDGRRTYIRSLCFVLQNVVRKMFPDKVLAIDYSLPSGLYCEIREIEPYDDGRPKAYAVTEEQISGIVEGMQALIEADLPFHKVMMGIDECEQLYAKNHQFEKINLLKSLERPYNNVYFLDGQADTFYGPLAVSTGILKIFNVVGFNDGFCLQYPMDGDPDKIMPVKRGHIIGTEKSK